jgi:hypothetical protein
MGRVVYTSKSTIERKRGPLRIAHLPGEAQPLAYSVHGAIAEHYRVDPAKLSEFGQRAASHYPSHRWRAQRRAL